ncbi:hypothetical protein [Albirhodobacter sp. R86504]|uniref:hypothetical protein n=1 Tax=Albirhodobacter sp. R86504 TaxID=3093848 RepID=UPI00367269E9
MDMTVADPKGLIRESYKIEGITAEECRSIFVDWALSLPEGVESVAAMRAALAQYGADADHPMSKMLTEGMTAGTMVPQRRGGRAAKFAS